MANPTNEERETSIYQNMADKSQWSIITEDPATIRKMAKIGATHVRTLFGGAEEYTIRRNQLSFVKGRVSSMTDERKAQLATRMRSIRPNKELQGIQEAKLASQEGDND